MIYAIVGRMSNTNDATEPNMTNEINKLPQQLSEQEMLITETVIKIAAIERLLLKAGVITENGIKEEIKTISQEIIKHITTIKQNISGN